MNPQNDSSYTTNGQKTVHAQQQQPAVLYQPIQPVQPVLQVVPQMYMPAAHQFLAALPLHGLTQSSAPVDCPVCRSRAMTNTSFEIGDNTQYVPLKFLRLCQSLGSSLVLFLRAWMHPLPHRRYQRCGPQMRKLWNSVGKMASQWRYQCFSSHHHVYATNIAESRTNAARSFATFNSSASEHQPTTYLPIDRSFATDSSRRYYHCKFRRHGQ